MIWHLLTQRALRRKRGTPAPGAPTGEGSSPARARADRRMAVFLGLVLLAVLAFLLLTHDPAPGGGEAPAPAAVPGR